MSDYLYVIAGILIGLLAGWYARGALASRRQRQQIEAWNRARKFFSSNNRKN